MITPEKVINIQDSVLSGRYDKKELTGEERQLAHKTEQILNGYLDGLMKICNKNQRSD